MQKSRVIIIGPNLSELVDLIKKDLDNNGDDSVLIGSGQARILIFEGYYTFDFNDRLMVTMVFDFSDEGKCKIDIVTGGDEARLLNIIWDPEKKVNKKIVKALNGICDSKNWGISEVVMD